MTRVFLRPAIDTSASSQQPPARLKVRKPTGTYLAAEGEFQNLDSYWLRRLNDKDVEQVDGVVEEPPAASLAAIATSQVASEPGGKTVVKK